MLILIFFLFTTLSFAQESLFDDYLNLVEKQSINSSEAMYHLSSTEKKFFKEITQLADEIKFDDSQLSYLSVQDNFKEAQLTWSAHSKEVSIKKKLKALIKKPQIVLDDPTLARTFKDNRKFAHIMRESFYLFDETHTVPSMLDDFVKPFGKLNDAVVVGDTKLIKKYAKQVLKNYDALKINKINKAFRPIKTSEFFKYIKEIKSDAAKIFSKTITTTHDFHTVRKFYKRFLFIYYSLDDYIAADKFKRLDRFITKFGELNDIYTDMKFRFGMNIKSYEIEFPKAFKNEIISTLGFLEEDMNSVELVKTCGSFFKPR